MSSFSSLTPCTSINFSLFSFFSSPLETWTWIVDSVTRRILHDNCASANCWVEIFGNRYGNLSSRRPSLRCGLGYFIRAILKWIWGSKVDVTSCANNEHYNDGGQRKRMNTNSVATGNKEIFFGWRGSTGWLLWGFRLTLDVLVSAATLWEKLVKKETRRNGCLLYSKYLWF